jgi:hypothetical protein
MYGLLDILHIDGKRENLIISQPCDNSQFSFHPNDKLTLE